MKKLVFILLSALAVSCGNENAPKPERLLSEDEMVDILYDISLLQAVKSYKSQILDTNSVDPRTYIYKKYKLDSITLSQNHNWYASDLENYEKIQGRVSNRIRSEQDKLKPNKKGNPDKLIAKPGLGTGQQREHKIE